VCYTLCSDKVFACGILLALCLADDYRVRERAGDALSALAENAPLVVAILEQSAANGPAEMRRRAGAALAAFYAVGPRWYSKLPWIDMLPQDWPDRQAVIQRYLSRVRELQIGWECGEPWLDYRVATRLLVVDLLRAGESREAVQRLLDAMAENERVYIMRRNAYWATKE
jgi:hypothetical protein